MSYHYSKYDFAGPESDLERYRFRSASSSSLLLFAGMFRRNFPFMVGANGAESDFRRNIHVPIGPNSRYQTRYSRYAQVGPPGSDAPGS